MSRLVFEIMTCLSTEFNLVVKKQYMYGVSVGFQLGKLDSGKTRFNRGVSSDFVNKIVSN